MRGDWMIPNPLSRSALHEARDIFTMLHTTPARWALFLDIDGTLLDIAPTPDAVIVPQALPHILACVADKLGGAMALVTGRDIAFVDTLFQPYRFSVAGLHGAEMRLPNQQRIETALSESFIAARNELCAAALRMAGIIFEDKGAALALHYRLAPDYAPDVERLMQRAAIVAGPQWQLQYGKMVIELHPSHANKGKALQTLMAQPSFDGRLPISIGDDLTDEDMFAMAISRGGRAIRIGSDGVPTQARAWLATPADLRVLLAQLAGSRADPPP